LAQLDGKIAGGDEFGEFTAHDSRTYLAWSNSLTRTIAQLGLKGVAAKTPTLAEHLAKRAAERAASEPEGAAA